MRQYYLPLYGHALSYERGAAHDVADPVRWSATLQRITEATGEPYTARIADEPDIENGRILVNVEAPDTFLAALDSYLEGKGADPKLPTLPEAARTAVLDELKLTFSVDDTAVEEEA